MQKLFNNPWFISALGAIGAIYLGLSVYSGGTDGAEASAGSSEDIPPFVTSGSSPRSNESTNDTNRAGVGRSNTTGTGKAAIDDISWLMDIERDPFAVIEDELARTTQGDVKTPPKGLPKGIDLATRSTVIPTTPSLTAVFVGNQTRAAVINKQFLREGDRIGRYQVVAISPNIVELRYGDTRLLLEPEA